MVMRTHLPLVLAALLLALTSTAAATARTARAPQVARVQRLAQVMTPHGVHSRPDGHSPVTELVQPRRPAGRVVAEGSAPRPAERAHRVDQEAGNAGSDHALRRRRTPRGAARGR